MTHDFLRMCMYTLGARFPFLLYCISTIAEKVLFLNRISKINHVREKLLIIGVHKQIQSINYSI